MLSVLRWLSRRSLKQLHALGAVLGWLAWLFSRPYRHRLEHNARLAGVPREARRAAVAEAGRLVAELPRLWLRPRGQGLQDAVQWQGEELLEQWLAAGRGIVLLTPHMGSFEVAAQAYAERYGARQPLTVLYRPARQPWLRELEETARGREHLDTAPASLAGVRQMIRALRRGGTVGLLPDQVPPDGMGVWAPFFGQPAYTMTLAARLARQTGAPIGVVWCERLPGGRGFTVRVQPLEHPLPERRTGGDAVDGATLELADATAINRSMEAVIAQRPEQYLWGYNRYKAPRRLAAP